MLAHRRGEGNMVLKSNGNRSGLEKLHMFLTLFSKGAVCILTRRRAYFLTV